MPEDNSSRVAASKHKHTSGEDVATLTTDAVKVKRIKGLKGSPFLQLVVFAAIVAIGVMISLVLVGVELLLLESQEGLPSEVIPGNLRDRIPDDLKECSMSGSETFLSAMFGHSTCSEIFQRNPSSSPGYYYLMQGAGLLSSVYCDSNLTCGGTNGGWMRMAKLDFTVDTCPQGFKVLDVKHGLSGCVMVSGGPGCSSALLSSLDVQYSKVCGRIDGFAIGSPDGVLGISHKSGRQRNYFDGVILFSNKEHIWSFVAGGCICDYVKPYFIGNNWICDQSNICSTADTCDKPLFSKNDCGKDLPYYRELSKPTRAFVEMRVCRSQVNTSEEVAVRVVVLYVQ